MKTTIEDKEGKLHVTLDGELDTAAAAETEKEFKPLMDNGNKEIILDCENLKYISSSGLRLFLALLKNTKAKGGKLILKHVNDNILKVFKMTGFSSLFEIQ